MKPNNRNLIARIIALGILISVLVYLFHPGVGQFTMIINGEPVSEPWVRLAALPTMLLVLAFSVALVFLLFVGVGLFFFVAAMLFAVLGVMLVAPYLWPVLLIIFLVVALMSVGNGDRR